MWIASQCMTTCSASAERCLVAQLLIPVGTPLWGEVEEVPDRLERAYVSGILPGIPRRVEELRPPEVANLTAVAVEHVEHRPLRPLRGLSEIVAVEAAAGR